MGAQALLFTPLESLKFAALAWLSALVVNEFFEHFSAIREEQQRVAICQFGKVSANFFKKVVSAR